MCAPVREDLRPMFPFLLRVNRTNGQAIAVPRILGKQRAGGALLWFLFTSRGALIKCAYFNWLVRLDATPPLDMTKTSAGFIGINRIVTSETTE